MPLIELKNYMVKHPVTGKPLQAFNFDLSRGEACSINCDEDEDAYLLLRAIATLTYPHKGDYFYLGNRLDFSNYRGLLPYKKKIAYIASDSAMISNKTIFENLMLMPAYFDNYMKDRLDEESRSLCRLFNIYDKLYMRPAELNPTDLQVAITIRELIKSPELILLERPEDFISHPHLPVVADILQKKLSAGVPIVFLSHNDTFVNQFSNDIRFYFF